MIGVALWQGLLGGFCLGVAVVVGIAVAVLKFIDHMDHLDRIDRE